MLRRWIALLLLTPVLPCSALLLYALGWIPHKGILVVTLVMVAFIEGLVVLSMALGGHEGSRRKTPYSPTDVLYADGLVTILRDRIIFHRYGPFTSREVLWSDIHAIRALRATARTGKWRLGGTGDFETWFPTDWLRFRRDTIFLAEMKAQGGYKVGFTVKDSARVRELLRSLGVLHPICPRCGYDLRASEQRCPECGAAIAANGAASGG